MAVAPHLRARQLLPAGLSLQLMVTGNTPSLALQSLWQRLVERYRVSLVPCSGTVRDCYFAADFFVHPTFYDPCSHVVLEALACGLPVVTTRYNGAGELLRPPREGYVIDDPHDHEHLAWCLGRLLDPARRAACGLAA